MIFYIKNVRKKLEILLLKFAQDIVEIIYFLFYFDISISYRDLRIQSIHSA